MHGVNCMLHEFNHDFPFQVIFIFIRESDLEHSARLAGVGLQRGFSRESGSTCSSTRSRCTYTWRARVRVQVVYGLECSVAQLISRPISCEHSEPSRARDTGIT